MKKIITYLCVLSLALVGCKNKDTSKTLKCSMEREESSNNIVQTLEANFEDDKVISINMKIQTILNEKYIPYIDSFVTQMEEQFSNYKDKRGITSNVYQDESSVTISISFNVNNLDEEAKKELGFIDTNDNLENAKKSLEKSGYICK